MSTKTIDRAIHHKKLEEVSTKAREGLYTTTNMNHLLSIVDKILHSQWKEDTVKLDTNISTTANQKRLLPLCNTAKCICISDLNHYYNMDLYASINSTIYAILLSVFALVTKSIL